MQNLVGRKFLAPMISTFALVVYMSVYWSNSVYEAEISNLNFQDVWIPLFTTFAHFGSFLKCPIVYIASYFRLIICHLRRKENEFVS